ncbi:MAG TPA: YIP1 family protein [Thermoanaerobaculia bacterium]|nr:YIP1 family protein [Thermoanaerobaculia bacterium]HUM30601.1 YIP1 family protein [Thermoanaerobaculia bacterium]HXK68871.1 YIP1 family protein [Thermoanaerobaculia bacterium]
MQSHSPLPWEEYKESCSIKILAQTIVEILKNPSGSLGSLKNDGRWKKPTYFAMVVVFTGLLFSSAWSVLIIMGMKFPEPEPPGVSVSPVSLFSTFFGVLLVLIPLLVTISTIMYSSVLHGFLRLYGEGKAGFNVTYKVICYSSASCIAGIIPLLGWIIPAIWGFGLVMVGTLKAHSLKPWKGIVATFIASVIFLAILMVILFGILYLYIAMRPDLELLPSLSS